MTKYNRLEDVLRVYGFYETGDPVSTEHKNLLGEPIIFSAARNGDIEAIDCLLKNGAEINSRGEFQNTPLHEAISACQFGAARYLLSKGANPDLLNSEGKQPKDLCWDGEWPGVFGDRYA